MAEGSVEAAFCFHPLFAWLGLFFAIAALGMFHLTHHALERNWSISLDVRENHESRDERDLLESSALDVFGVLALAITSVAQLGCRFRGIGWVWSPCILAASPGKSE